MRFRGLLGSITLVVLFFSIWHCPSIPNSDLRICQVVKPWWDSTVSSIDPRICKEANNKLLPLRTIYASKVDQITPHVLVVTNSVKAKAQELADGPLKPIVYRVNRHVVDPLGSLSDLYAAHIAPLGLGVRADALRKKVVELSKKLLRRAWMDVRHFGNEYVVPAWAKFNAEISRLMDELVWPRVREFNDQVVKKQVRKILEHLEARQNGNDTVARPESPVTESKHSIVNSASLSSSATLSGTVDTTSSVPESTSATSTQSTATDHPSVKAADPAIYHEKVDWADRVNKTVTKALDSMEEDAQSVLKRLIDDAKPDIVELLQAISKRGLEVNEEVSLLAEQVEKRTETFSQPSELYRIFEDRSRELAEMALSVRDRSRELAETALDNIMPIREVTLEAIDDYFDVVLLEAARQVASRTTGGDWDEWKAYHDLKNVLLESRKLIEDYIFNVDIVNQAMLESQQASVIIVQDINQRLQDVRAACQLSLQERSVEEAREKYGDAEQVDDADYYIVDSDDIESTDFEDTGDEEDEEEEFITVVETETVYVTKRTPEVTIQVDEKV